ncbi:DegT/DnrJ/EryC1/StrS family aminotransferase [Olleya sp. YS]|uniref:DegT/DnrJ/EryC1/StrS family aminotransferase n=1 Tax=Olleya sp. YS TaxID=3028318 RepID=UPI0024343177|nr:DegT/DnrJ/EryC1/StrS family aminotransferase [Olleya sp. YS]WGD35143.1 DegT/DnrJ/EryC1/StrS family aminotransferase [Olleya sp. YS]
MIKFLDLKKINARFENEFNAEFSSFLNNGQYILGEGVKTFEANYADYCGTKHCVGVSNGFDALVLIFKGYIELGVLKKGDEVIVPAHTFIASTLAIIEAGLTPVLIEPNPDTFNIEATTIKHHITDKTKAILVVHLYGQLCDMQSITELAKLHNLIIVEDAAQAHGAKNQIGSAGSLADAAAFSFYPAKNLGALGDAGAITTNNSSLAEVVSKLRNYGTTTKYQNEILGVNNRLDELQALFLNIKLKSLDQDNKARQTIAKRYISEIKNQKIKLPYYDGSQNHVFHLFVVLVENRKSFIEYLKVNNIETAIHYPTPPHKQQALYRINHLKFPITEKIHETCVSLPISPIMTNLEVDTVIDKLNNY